MNKQQKQAIRPIAKIKSAVKKAAAQERQIRILIAIPCYQNCEIETMESIRALETPKNVKLDLAFQRGYVVDASRNMLVEKSLIQNYDYTFFVDSDMLLPPNTLIKLLKAEKDIICGWYIKKRPDTFIPELFRRNDGTNAWENIVTVPENQIISIDGCGFGCVLIKNEVFRNIQEIDGPNWFQYIKRKDWVCSEDLVFCMKAAARNFSVFCDTGIRCGHIGKMIY